MPSKDPSWMHACPPLQTHETSTKQPLEVPPAATIRQDHPPPTQPSDGPTPPNVKSSILLGVPSI